MKNLILMLPLAAGLAACEQPAGTVATGAAIGAAVNDDDRLKGAAVGAAAGAAAAIVLDNLGNDTCLYRDTRTGGTYRAACP